MSKHQYLSQFKSSYNRFELTQAKSADKARFRPIICHYSIYLHANTPGLHKESPLSP